MCDVDDEVDTVDDVLGGDVELVTGGIWQR